MEKVKFLKTWLMLVMLLVFGVGTTWAETKTGSWDLTSASTDWTASLNETYFSQPYGYKKANGTLTNKSISDFSTTGITQIKVGFKCLQNGGTTSKLTIYLVDKDGNTLGSGVVVTPDNKSAASQTTYKYATFTTNLTGATGFMMKVTTFGKNILINGAEYEVTYTSGGGSTPTALSAPTNLTSSNVTTTGATLSWDAVANANSYKVKIGSTEYDANTNSYSATGLTASTEYTWSVKAIGDGVNYSTSAYAANANFTTEAEQGGDDPSGESASFIFNTDAGLSALGITKPAQSQGTDITSPVISGGITMTATSGSTATRVWNSNGTTSLRVYANNNGPAGTLTFSGATITEIVFTGTVPMTANVGTFSNKTWTGESNSVTFTATSGVTISTIEVTYVESDEKYTVTVANDIANGTVTAYPTSAAEGATITLTATPSIGYLFGEWNVTNASTSEAITVTDNRFTMPAANVNVSATFTAKPARPENEIFYESFDTNDGTGGNDDQWSGTIASNDIKQDNDGWEYTSAKGAKQCAKFGAGSALGTATTPALGQACNATLTFKAAAWNSNSESTTLKLSVIGGGSISPATVTLTKGAWDTFNATLTNLTASSKIKFEGNAASNSRFFLDEVSVVKTGDVVTLQSVTVSGTPTKTTYTAGDNFEPAGLTVTGHYSNNSDETITEGITWSNPDALTTGQTSVSITATVDGVESEAYEVTGLTVSAPVTLSSISATGTPATFWKGDEFSHEGITVTALWSDENETDVTSECTYTGYDMSTPGQQTVTVTYQGKSDTYDINVQTIANTPETAYTVAEAKALIDAGKDLATQVYVKGTVSEIVTPWSDQYSNITYAISADGFQLFRCVTNGAEVDDDVIAYGTLIKYNTTYELAAGNEIVKRDKVATLSIENINIVDGADIPSPSITTNVQGDYSIEYVSGSETVVRVENGQLVAAGVGTATITATLTADGYKTVETTFTITINAITITHIILAGDLTYTTYFIGDAFNHDGLQVKACYNDGHQEDVTSLSEWSVDPSTLNEAGDHISVTVSARYVSFNVEQDYEVTVNKFSAMLVFAQAEYTFSIDEDMQVVATSPVSNGTITYALIDGDEDAILIDEETGYIVCETAGTYTVTALIAEWGNYASGVAVCTVNIVAPSDEITVSAAQYATYYNAEHAFIMPEGLEGIVVYSVTGNELNLQDAYEEGDVVPAGEPLILHATSTLAEATQFTLVYGTTSEATYKSAGTNLLSGTSTAAEWTEGGAPYYRLSQHDGQVGFYYGAEHGAAFQPGANKAYLALNSASGAPAHFLFENGEQTATAIENTEANDQIVKFIENGKVYILRAGVVYDVLGNVIR